jgi:hypothetical protein
MHQGGPTDKLTFGALEPEEASANFPFDGQLTIAWATWDLPSGFLGHPADVQMMASKAWGGDHEPTLG